MSDNGLIGEHVEMIEMSDIHADAEFNCRGVISPIDVVDLVKDIEKNSLLQPVVVSLYTDKERALLGKKYKLLAGFRRHMAHRVLAKTHIKALVKEKSLSDVDARFMNLAENLQRKELTITQEANALQALYNLGVGEVAVAERTGMSRGWVQIRFMLLKLPEPIQQEVAAGMIKQQEIRALYTIHKTGNAEALTKAVHKIKDAKLKGTKANLDLPATPEQAFSKAIKKQVQDKESVLAMMTHIQNYVGNGLHTRVLAWQVGEISTEELFVDVGFASNKPYIKPTPIEWSNYVEGIKDE